MKKTDIRAEIRIFGAKKNVPAARPFGCLAGRFVALIAQSGPFGVQKCCFWPETFFLWTSVQRIQQKNVDFLVSRHGGDKKIGRVRKKMDLGPKNCIFDQKFCIFFHYTYETTLFFGSDGPDSMG